MNFLNLEKIMNYKKDITQCIVHSGLAVNSSNIALIKLRYETIH